MDDEWLKKYREEAAIQLQKDMDAAMAAEKKDLVKAERKVFTYELGMLRLKKKVSQSELAARTGLKQSYISRIEGGKANPSLNTILKITKALEADLVLE